MQLIPSHHSLSLPSVARALLTAAAVAMGFLLIASNVGGQTDGDDHGNSFDTATPVELGTSVEGRIDPGDDRDVFKFDLSGATGPTDLWVYTRGDFDTFGGLYDGEGTLIALNDDGFFDDQIRAFSLRSVVPPGVYYVIAVGYSGETGDYTLHARAVTDPGDSIETAKPLALGVHDGGTVDTGDGVDYFRLDFTEKKHVIIDARTTNLLPLDAVLLDADGDELTANIGLIRLRGFGALFPIGIDMFEDFEPGTYYLKVTSPGAPSLFGPPPDEAPVKAVPYAIFFEEDMEYTEMLANCAADTAALNDPDISDPLYSCQWHLDSPQWQDIDVQPVWEQGIKGEGINVAVVDDGMYHNHEDLKDNVDSELNHDYSVREDDEGDGEGEGEGDGSGEGDGDIYSPFDHHGTHVSGMIAARDNDIGVRGVAPRATVYGYNFLSGFNSTGPNLLDAMTRNMGVTAVSNNSWGPADGPGASPAFSLWRQAIAAGITEGYDGKGIFYVFAAGNGHLAGDDSNLDGFANTHAVTAACSVHSEGRRAGYSEMGANLWVCAPSNDRPGSLGGARGILTTENSDRYYHDFGGTSAAAPLVAGVGALTRSANAGLTWRDVKLILAASASKNDPASLGWDDGATKHPVSSTDSYHFNHEYGFGVVNAAGAVALAKRWTNLPEMQAHSVSSDEEQYIEIPDAKAFGSATTTTHTLTVESDIGFTEFVEVTIAFEHDSFRDLEILLESPSGAISILSVPYDTYDGLSNFFGEGFIPLYGPYQFGSSKHLGEDPNGDWKLHITDRIPAAGGAITGYAISVYGHQRAPGAATLDSVEVNVGGERLDVAWTAPDESGDSDITSYDLRYIPSDADETDLASWTVLEGIWTSESGGDLEHTFSGLTDGTQYDVQVRAVNSNGGGMWSETLTETPMSSRCVTGGAVTDRENTGLILDCEALLEARISLQGTLNWAQDTAISDWDDIGLDGNPARVTRLTSRGGDLDGRIPAALGRLGMLVQLNLRDNELIGEIPVELNALANLEELALHGNDLSGAIPDLSGLTNLKMLWLASNDLEGAVPAWLNGMSGLEDLNLWGNDLIGALPDLSGMTGLETLQLNGNMLDGGVPDGSMLPPNVKWLLLQENSLGGTISDLSGLTGLRTLWLYGNGLTGEIPAANLPAGLTSLELRNNELTGEIPDLTGLADLRYLRLQQNRLSGTIPGTLGDLERLERLQLNDNRFTGIDAGLANAADTLQRLHLKDNNFTSGTCLPGDLANVADNDFTEAGLSACPSP